MMRGDMPQVTVEMRIEPMIRTMVQHMLISEGELNDAIYQAAHEAVIEFDWRKNLKKLVENTLQSEVTQLLRNVISRLQYDEELKPLFIQMLKSVIEKEMRDGR